MVFPPVLIIVRAMQKPFGYKKTFAALHSPHMRGKQAAKVSPIKAGRAITAVMTPKPPAFSHAGRLLPFVVKNYTRRAYLL